MRPARSSSLSCRQSRAEQRTSRIQEGEHWISWSRRRREMPRSRPGPGTATKTSVNVISRLIFRDCLLWGRRRGPNRLPRRRGLFARLDRPSDPLRVFVITSFWCQLTQGSTEVEGLFTQTHFSKFPYNFDMMGALTSRLSSVVLKLID